MSNTQTTEIQGNPNPGPSLEESYEALKAAGVVSDEDDGAVIDPVAQGGADEDPEALNEDGSPVDVTDEDLEEDEEELEYAPATDEERAAAEEATARAGLDLNEVSQEWFDNEGLTDETYEKLSKAGYPREMVDIYIEGLTTRTAGTANDAYELMGGKEGYGEMIDWAIDNLSDADQKAFDKAINSNNRSTAMMAIKALKGDYEAALMAEMSYEPEDPVETRGGPTASGGGFENMDDYMTAMQDPRYDTSESYRKQVAARLSKSNI
jgi:hypothetical protein